MSPVPDDTQSGRGLFRLPPGAKALITPAFRGAEAPLFHVVEGHYSTGLKSPSTWNPLPSSSRELTGALPPPIRASRYSPPLADSFK